MPESLETVFKFQDCLWHLFFLIRLFSFPFPALLLWFGSACHSGRLFIIYKVQALKQNWHQAQDAGPPEAGWKTCIQIFQLLAALFPAFCFPGFHWSRSAFKRPGSVHNRPVLIARQIFHHCPVLGVFRMFQDFPGILGAAVHHFQILHGIPQNKSRQAGLPGA